MRFARHSPPRARAGAAWIVGVVVLIEVAVSSGIIDQPLGAWFAGCRGKPTSTQRTHNGIDFSASTHQWLADQAIEILQADGYDRIVSFMNTQDSTAPQIRDPRTKVLTAATETYRWRLMDGAAAADCRLYHQIPDHLHNFWTHKGRRMIVGSSAASNAEKAFSRATTAWRRGDRALAMTWLGASLHLVQDSCVPQHNFFGIAINHTPYERWVKNHQAALAVKDGAVLASDFRVHGGHGGDNWSSAHPRGWADECAHRAAGILRSASANVPKVSSKADPQWRTADHVAFTQRLGAGYVKFFFDTVGGP
jgi:hypothetical protein